MITKLALTCLVLMFLVVYPVLCGRSERMSHQTWKTWIETPALAATAECAIISLSYFICSLIPTGGA